MRPGGRGWASVSLSEKNGVRPKPPGQMGCPGATESLYSGEALGGHGSRYQVETKVSQGRDFRKRLGFAWPDSPHQSQPQQLLQLHLR